MENGMSLVDTYLIPWAIKIAIALAIFLVGKIIAGYIARFITRLMERGRMDAMLVKFLSTLCYAILLVAVVLAAIDSLGVPITSLLAIVGAAGLAIGLALKDSLANFAAGVMILILRPFRTGDFIDAGGILGVVDEIGMFATFMHTPDNRRIIVPNSSIINGTITNANALPTRRIDLVIGISYDDSIAEARRIITEVVNADPRVLKDPAFTVGAMDLADSSVNLFVRPWVKSEDFWMTRSDLIERIKTTLEDNGLTIPYPQQDVYMHTVAAEKTEASKE